MLSLKMNPSQCPPSISQAELRSVAERSVVMRKQEETRYKCRDYLLRRKMDTLAMGRSPSPDLCATPPHPSQMDEYDTANVDSVCRQKMCEWSYRIVDYYHASREIVAIAFSYLDRFLDACCCDRTAFKLAAMTSLHLASKITSSKQFSISTLAKLSRGEFDEDHIAEMEGIILQSLSWYMHPPTALAFANHLYAVIPTTEDYVKRKIFQRASFFTELAVLDYFFVTQNPSAIALAAILNSMEGIDESYLAKDAHKTFLFNAEHVLGIDPPERKHLDLIREKLWDAYMHSAQSSCMENTPVSTPRAKTNDHSMGIDHASAGRSPVSVAFMSSNQ